MAKESPAFQDKEERRLIILSSMNNLLKFHEIERQEKYNTLKFYSTFLGGGIALLVGISKISTGLEAEILKNISITIIVMINLLVIKKLIAVRGASNNIYHEYGRRLRFLLNSHSEDLDEIGCEELNNTFKKYIDTQKEGPLLPKYSVDTFEVKGLSFITVLFSLSYWLPISKLFSIWIAIMLTFFHAIAIIIFTFKIINDATKMPNISQKK